MPLFVYENVLVRPLFFDALSGEFHPPTDLEKRAHTLGRLAFAAILKGSREAGSGASEYSYEPSWAPGVLAISRCLEDTDDLNAELIGLSLRAPSQTIEFQDATVQESESSGVIIVSSTGTRELPLIIGPEIAEARQAVTVTAQAFFNSI